jgi:Flp pilus assembly protein TadG
MTSRKKWQRGNSLVEFALASAFLFPALVGTFQLGFAFYTYNMLQSAVVNGARYGAYRTYRCLNGAPDVTKVKTAIQNMTVYGTPNSAGATIPVVPGLSPSNVNVTFTLSSTQIPTAVTVSISSYTVNFVFSNFRLTGRPKYTIPYLGRYAIEESEP